MSIFRIARIIRFVASLLGVAALAACAINGGSSSFDLSRWPTQEEVTRQLQQASMPTELRKQIIRLHSRDPVERATAASQLGKLAEGAAPAVPYLIGLLQDDTQVQLSRYLGAGYTSSVETTPGEEASHALAEIGDPASNSLILAAKALGQIGDISAVDFLIKLLDDPDRGVRATAAIALGSYRHPMAAQRIMDAYPTASATARTDMIFALANINDVLAVPFLVKRAGDPDPAVRAAVMLALGKLGDARAIPALLAGLKDSDEITRTNAAYSLGNYYSPEVVTALIQALRDPASRVQQAAAESLKSLSGLDFGIAQDKWQQWWQQQRRQMQPGTK